MLEWGLFFLGIFSIVWFWASQTKAREQAILLGRRICNERDLQLLDETVAFNSMRPRWINSNILIERVFRFDYSTDGDDRHKGQLCLLASRVVWINIEDQRTWFS